MTNPIDLTQLPLWPDNEMIEIQQPAQNEDQGIQQITALSTQGESPATQLYLPDFELE